MSIFVGIDALASSGDLRGFAAANALQLIVDAPPPLVSVGVLQQLSGGQLSTGVSGPGWQTGNLRDRTEPHAQRMTLFGQRVTVISQNSSSIPRAPVGFLALTLSRRLPNMVLDSKRNNTILGSSLLEPPTRSQRLSLEGDFDRHFDLFVPPGYETDALYVFTPDLMALMIDEVSGFDVEIRDDQLVVYSPGGIDLTKAQTWRWIERVMTVVGSKTFSRADGYSDPRLGDKAANAVAPAGQVLQRSFLTGDYKIVATAFAIIVGAGVLGSTLFIAAWLLFFLW